VKLANELATTDDSAVPVCHDQGGSWQMRQLDQPKEQLQTQPEGQLSLSDPDARSMASHGKATGIAATTSSC